MDSVYENVDYMPSATASDGNCSLYEGISLQDREREREVTSPKWTKVLPIVLGFYLVFALGGLCTLWMLYSSLSVKLSAQETKSTLMAREFQELTVNYNRVKEHLSAKDNMVRELTDNYTRVRERLSAKDTMERELEERMANYTRVREQLSFYEAFTAQSLNCNMSLTAWGGKFYFFSSDKLNWTNSRDVCVSKGADLVTITSQSQQDFLVFFVSETHWIGLNDLDTEGHWVWVNNRTLNDTGLQFWHKREYGPGEPDNWKQGDPPGENCASLGNRDGYFNKWFDQSCKEQKKFICEKNEPFSLTDEN